MIASELEVLLGLAPPPEPLTRYDGPGGHAPRVNRWGDTEYLLRTTGAKTKTWLVYSTCSSCKTQWRWFRHSSVKIGPGYGKCAQCAASEHNARMRFAARVLSGAVRGRHDH